MATTSLKLPDDVKELAASAAKHRGMTPHAFMVDAIRQVALAAEKRAQLLADAEESRSETLASGKGFAADEVHAYIRGRSQRKASPRPRAKTWRK